MKRKIISLICLCLLLATLFGCGGNTSDTALTEQTTVAVTEALTDAVVEQPSIESWTIVIPDSANRDEQYASSYFQSYIEAKTGKKLNVVKEGQYQSGKAFFIGNTKALAADGLTDERVARVRINGDKVFVYGTGGYEVAATKRLAVSLCENLTAESKSFNAPTDAEYTDVVSVVEPIAEFGELPVAICDQKNNEIAIYDVAPVVSASLVYKTAEPELKYTYYPSIKYGFSTSGTFDNRVDEFRIRYSKVLGKYVMLFTSSKGYMGVAEYPSGKKVWGVSLSGYGPHSAEYLPNGYVAFALSGNGDESKSQIRVYDITNGTTAYASISMTGAHGVLWDEVRSILWCYGMTDLRAVEIDDSGSKPVIKELTLYHSDVALNGHDISSVPGESDMLIVGGGKGVQGIYKSTGATFTPAGGSLKASAIKCLCVAPASMFSGSTANMKYFFVRTYAQNVYASHDTNNFDVYWGSSADKKATKFVKITFSDRAFYKARIIDYAY